MDSITLRVPDISCQHCVKTISAALEALDGVQHVAVDVSGKTVQVDYDAAKVTPDAMAATLAAEDYPVAG
jgi:copper ion binding protein